MREDGSEDVRTRGPEDDAERDGRPPQRLRVGPDDGAVRDGDRPAEMADVGIGSRASELPVGGAAPVATPPGRGKPKVTNGWVYFASMVFGRPRTVQRWADGFEVYSVDTVEGWSVLIHPDTGEWIISGRRGGAPMTKQEKEELKHAM